MSDIETPRYSPIPYLRLRFLRADQKKVSVWVRETTKPGSKLRYFREVDENGEDTDPGVLIVSPQCDIISEKPARVNLKYGLLEVIR